LEIAAIQALIQSFATHALGLDLGSPIVEVRELPAACQRALGGEPSDVRAVWSAWKTGRGDFAILARYDPIQSARVKAHVLRFEWWIDGQRHDSWYYTYRKFPAEWTAGCGRPNRW